MSTDINDIDKLDETISFRIPEYTKNLIEKMPLKYRRKMNEEVLKTICKCIHESRFDCNLYLKSK